MKHEYDRVPPSDLLPQLDAEPGPMPQLSAAEAHAIAWGAVSRWAAGVPGVEPADGELGPARPLPAEQAERLAQQVMRRQRGLGLRVACQLGSRGFRAAAVMLAVCAAGASFAAYRFWPRSGSDASARAKPASAESSEHMPPQVGPALPSAAAPSVRPEAASKAKPAPSGRDNAPEELLAHANALRAQRRWVAAEHLYREARGSAATELQRYVALVASASLSLQHLGKPARALALYRSALALMPNGDLEEEAEFGMAECYRALGDTSAELAVLQQFSVDHPDSWIIESVRQRLAVLSGR